MNAVQSSLDFDALKEVQAVMGADFPLLVESFFNDSVNLLIVMQKSIDENNAEALRQAAHSFKGSAGNMSAMTLAALCEDLEGLAFSGTTIGGGQLVTQINAEYKQVKAALEDI